LARKTGNYWVAPHLLAETLADSLAARLLNNYSAWTGAPSQITRRPKALDPRRLSRVLDYVESNWTQEITVDQLASVAALCRFHFSRMFKATTGCPPSRFIGRRRLELAKSLLVEAVSIAQVAQMSRFSSDSNFSRAFRRATGLTRPSIEIADANRSWVLFGGSAAPRKHAGNEEPHVKSVRQDRGPEKIALPRNCWGPPWLWDVLHAWQT
jgi:AraC-like DNA-binding protein